MKDLFVAGNSIPAFGRISPFVPEWLARAEVEAVIEPEIPIIDAHHHLWNMQGYPYELPQYMADISTGHHVIGSVFVECASHYRALSSDDERSVGETEFVASCAKTVEARKKNICAGIVGFADITRPAHLQRALDLHAAAGDGYFRGIRHSAGWDADPVIGNSHTDPPPGLYKTDEATESAKILGANGFSFDLWLYHPQLRDAVDLVRRCPGVTFVLNHCGGPLGYGTYRGHSAEVYREWLAGIRAVASFTNVFVKLGGLTNRLGAYDYMTMPRPPSSAALAEMWRPIIEPCITAFGPARSMFESNFPVEKMGCSYRTLWNAFKRIAEHYSADERRDLFAGAAERAYRLRLLPR